MHSYTLSCHSTRACLVHVQTVSTVHHCSYMHSTYMYECADMQAREDVGIYAHTCTLVTSIHSVLPSYTCNSEDGSMFMILFNTTLRSRGLTWCASWTVSLKQSLGSTYYHIHVIPEMILAYIYIQLQVLPEINV